MALGRERRLPLHQVESVFLYTDAAKNGNFETITLRGNGVRVQLPCTMPGYALLREIILKSVPPEAIRRGESDRAAYDRRQTRESVICLSVCCACLVGMASFGMVKEITDDRRIERLARNGAFATARVTGNDFGVSDRDLKVVEYVFTVGGKAYSGENRLMDTDARIRVDDMVPVCYMPRNPSDNRLGAMMDWRRSLLHSLLLVVPLLASPLLIPGFLWMKRRNARAAGAPAVA